MRRRRPSKSARAPSALICVAVGICGTSFTGAAAAESALTPSSVFVQAGGWQDTHALTTGLTWDWDKYWALGSGRLGGYWALALSRWSYPSVDGRRETWLGQIGLVPTFRYRLNDGDSRWFAEAGVGVSWTTTLYRTRGKRFSTSFNFADHVGVGLNFGPSRA